MTARHWHEDDDRTFRYGRIFAVPDPKPNRPDDYIVYVGRTKNDKADSPTSIQLDAAEVGFLLDAIGLRQKLDFTEEQRVRVDLVQAAYEALEDEKDERPKRDNLAKLARYWDVYNAIFEALMHGDDLRGLEY